MFLPINAKTATKSVEKYSPICFMVLLARYIMKNTASKRVL